MTIVAVRTAEGRHRLLRSWEGKVPSEALYLFPEVLELLDEKDEEIKRLQVEVQTLLEAYLETRH